MTQRPTSSTPQAPRAGSHLRFGWWALLVFLCLGALLESLHGFKVQFYLAVGNETRRLLWTLAHANGTLLALINIAFGLSRPALRISARAAGLASRCLFAATLLLPGGFFLGGAFAREGDPGLGVLLVPPAFLLLGIAVYLAARGARS